MNQYFTQCCKWFKYEIFVWVATVFGGLFIFDWEIAKQADFVSKSQ